MRKRHLVTAFALLLSLTCNINAFAGWNEDETGWWYSVGASDGKENDTYFTNEWKWIDGNADGIYECYYFGNDGYLLTSTETPDGYDVNSNGAWTEDGIVQTRTSNTLELGVYLDPEFKCVSVTMVDNHLYLDNRQYDKISDGVYGDAESTLYVISNNEFKVEYRDHSVELFTLLDDVEVLE